MPAGTLRTSARRLVAFGAALGRWAILQPHSAAAAAPRLTCASAADNDLFVALGKSGYAVERAANAAAAEPALARVEVRPAELITARYERLRAKPASQWTFGSEILVNPPVEFVRGQ